MTLTKHAKTRITERKITLQDVYNCVKLGTQQQTKNNNIKYTYNNIYVILANNDLVVTVCYTKPYTKQIEKYAKCQGIGFYAAIKQLRGGFNNIACTI